MSGVESSLSAFVRTESRYRFGTSAARAGRLGPDGATELGAAKQLDRRRPFKSNFPPLAHRTREKWGTRKVVRVHA